jgi:hypothetical protein
MSGLRPKTPRPQVSRPLLLVFFKKKWINVAFLIIHE